MNPCSARPVKATAPPMPILVAHTEGNPRCAGKRLADGTEESLARLTAGCGRAGGSAATSPNFSPRVWKGGASAPPLQGPPDYSCVPCPAQSRRRGTARGKGPTEGGSCDFGGVEAPPFRLLPKKSGLGIRPVKS